MKYKQLKQGQAFTFEPDGAVFVRCRGGYRLGCGGPLLTAYSKDDLIVYPYMV